MVVHTVSPQNNDDKFEHTKYEYLLKLMITNNMLLTKDMRYTQKLYRKILDF